MTYYLAIIVLKNDVKEKIHALHSAYTTGMNWEYDDATDSWAGLYAWTTNKKLIKKFKKQRSKEYFKYQIIETDKDPSFEYSLKLKNHTYETCSDRSNESIVSTVFEYDFATDMNAVIELFTGGFYLPDPKLINKKLLSIMELISYSYQFYSYSDSLPFQDETSVYAQDLAERYDLFWNDYSYRDIYNNTYITEFNLTGRSVKLNEFNAFIDLFGDLFDI